MDNWKGLFHSEALWSQAGTNRRSCPVPYWDMLRRYGRAGSASRT